jgi:hypothetical protein
VKFEGGVVLLFLRVRTFYSNGACERFNKGLDSNVLYQRVNVTQNTIKIYINLVSLEGMNLLWSCVTFHTLRSKQNQTSHLLR